MSSWVHVILDLPPAAIAVDEPFWAAALGWPLGRAWADQPEFASFQPPDGEAYVHRQRLAEGGSEPTVHLDLEVVDPVEEASRLVSLGATLVATVGGRHTVRSPGGLPFGLVSASSHGPRPAAVAWPGGQRSRLLFCASQNSPDAP